MKIAYHYDFKAHVYTGESQVHKVHGYDDYILPQFATWIAKPSFDEETELAKFDVTNQKWFVELKPVEVTAYHKQTQESKVFGDASLVTEEYTLEKPLTQWDEWINNAWVTNEINKYIAEYNQIDDKRRALYSQMCDPLKMEAMDLMDEGKEVEALQLKKQALAAKQKIKTENPWPTPPTN
ncbi:hypothetical protein [Vibrio europaeus]|uniref:Phage tail protein n=1 Tax=Vibrio europaeus TaxID=300876 RepID=A0ABT5GMY8_9VIBR|nr:hypothetical protein [Vibrio europaeus]MDC5723087.1 hypothetical protein [Vibrio europaeus]MDC5728044.1 hypothetical protein [Vibrio europaeus]MDC5733347.1 hypothetical protein [Vibrio europaeus]MDC5738614.1 hypothetical protein [Vibrio europaeus]MDC5743824.1 hypothetical protein [Vibrio europaeus]